MFKAELCNLCGDCLTKCMFNPYTPAEAVAERKALKERKWRPILHNCAACHACNEFCPRGANPWDLISELQGIYGEVNQGNIWGERARKVDAERPRVLAAPPPPPADTVLATCTVGELNPEAFESLLYADLPKLVGPAYYCCQALEFFGDEKGEKERARGFVEAIARHNPKEVICYHDACYFLLTYRLPEYGIVAPFRPVHLFEHLLRTLEKNREKIRPLNRRVAYQRPCSSRNTPGKEPFLDRLLELIGCQRVPRRFDRGNALCCGDVYAYRGLADRAKDASRRNIEDALEHGAEALVYLCPSCLRMYGEICGERGLLLYQISELCRIAVGEKKG
jgi:Fe-S oxidoreductase